MADRGRAGLDGLDGPSAYEIALAHGFKGSPEQWLASLKGDRGADGESIPVEAVRAIVQAAVVDIHRPLNGRDGVDGKDGGRGLRGPRGERGMEGSAAGLPPLVSWRADVDRDKITKLWTHVRAGPSSGEGPHINLYPVRDEDDLIEYIDLIPEPA